MVVEHADGAAVVAEQCLCHSDGPANDEPDHAARARELFRRVERGRQIVRQSLEGLKGSRASRAWRRRQWLIRGGGLARVEYNEQSAVHSCLGAAR